MLLHHYTVHPSYRAFTLSLCPVSLLKYFIVTGLFNLLPSCLSQKRFSRPLPLGVIFFFLSLLPDLQSLLNVQLHSRRKPKAHCSGCCSALIFLQLSQILLFAAVSYSSSSLENLVSFFLFFQLSVFYGVPPISILQKTLANVLISHSQAPYNS